MSATDKKQITVETTVKAPIEKVWRFWNDPKHIVNWYHASDDWHAPYADNNLQLNGRFKTTMAAKDGSMSFDFEGIYTNIVEYKLIEYEIADGRKVKISFSVQAEEIKVTETFEMENINPLEMQKGGWQSILNNFKKYTESNP
jgi:uncharacterized protein YndB with AHSA1/START domain